MVDGIFTAGVGAVLWKDLLKFGFLIPVNWNNSYILANAEAFNKLSPDLQAKLRKAAKDAAKWNQETMQTGRGGIGEDADRRGLHHDHGAGRRKPPRSPTP